MIVRHRENELVIPAQGSFCRPGARGPIDVWPAASVDEETGELWFLYTLTNAERLSLPADLPVVLQCAAWATALLASEMGIAKGDSLSREVFPLIFELERKYQLL